MRYAIVYYADRDDIGTIHMENLTRARAMQLAADLNATAPAGAVYCIERW